MVVQNELCQVRRSPNIIDSWETVKLLSRLEVAPFFSVTVSWFLPG